MSFIAKRRRSVYLGKRRISTGSRLNSAYNSSSDIDDDSDRSSEPESEIKAGIHCKTKRARHRNGMSKGIASTSNVSAIQSKKWNITEMNSDVLFWVCDYMNLRDLLTIRDLHNKYISVKSLFKFVSTRMNSTSLLLLGKWPDSPKCMVDTKPFCHSFDSVVCNTKYSREKPSISARPHKRRRIEYDPEQNKNGDETAKKVLLFQASCKYIVYVDNQGIVTILNADSLRLLHSMELKDGKVNLMELVDDFILISFIRARAKGKIKLFQIMDADDSKTDEQKSENNSNSNSAGNACQSPSSNHSQCAIQVQLRANLSISNYIRTLQFDRKRNALIFLTDSKHLCFYEIAGRKSVCLCVHRIDPKLPNDAVISTANHTFIATPAELNVIDIDKVFEYEHTPGLHANDVLDERMAINVTLKDEEFPNQHQNYTEIVNEDLLYEIWREWAMHRCVKQIKRIQHGIVYFIQDASEFVIVRCDKHRILQDSDLKTHYTECLALNDNVFKYVEQVELNTPQRLDAVERKIKLPENHKIIEIVVLQQLVAVLDRKFNLWIFSDLGTFVRRKNILPEFEVYHEGNCQITWDGKRLWLMLDHRRLYNIQFESLLSD